MFDGLYYGVSDFAYAAYSTVQFLLLPTGYSCNFVIITRSVYLPFQLFAGVVSSAFLLAVAPKFGLGGVWGGLILFMGLRALAGFWRLEFFYEHRTCLDFFVIKFKTSKKMKGMVLAWIRIHVCSLNEICFFQAREQRRTFGNSLVRD